MAYTPSYILKPATKPFLFIGDIQGDVATSALVEERLDQYVPVFCGDYVDSWLYSPAMQARSLQRVLDMVEAGEAYALMGNHELGYLDAKRHRNGSYKPATAALLFAEHTRM